MTHPKGAGITGDVRLELTLVYVWSSTAPRSVQTVSLFSFANSARLWLCRVWQVDRCEMHGLARVGFTAISAYSASPPLDAWPNIQMLSMQSPSPVIE